jgi:hypothetical protein
MRLVVNSVEGIAIKPSINGIIMGATAGVSAGARVGGPVEAIVGGVDDRIGPGKKG